MPIMLLPKIVKTNMASRLVKGLGNGGDAKGAAPPKSSSTNRPEEFVLLWLNRRSFTILGAIVQVAPTVAVCVVMRARETALRATLLLNPRWTRSEGE